MSIAYADPRTPPNTLTNATVLQIVPALREEVGRAAVNVAYVLLEAGARAIIASDGGPLVRELKAYGGEWVQLRPETLNPYRLYRNKQIIEDLIAAERVDIVHAYSPGAAWSARSASRHMAVWFVTSIDETLAGKGPRGLSLKALASGDRVIVPSIYAAHVAMRRHRIATERLTVIPHSVDTAAYDPNAIGEDRIAGLRDAWRVPPGERIILVPGPIVPGQGQHLIPEVARVLATAGLRGACFVLTGDHRENARYARGIRNQTRRQGMQGIVRMVGHCPDMPAAMAAAYVIVVPTIDPPLRGDVVAEAQAMGKPVVTTTAGTLPENVVVPPRIPAHLRTGWVVRPNDAYELARALTIPLSLDFTGYRAVAARARQFAEYMFSPQSVAWATRAVYTSLLARDR